MTTPTGATARHGNRGARRLARPLHRARWSLFWERAWPAIWPAAGIAGLFLALALLDVLPRLGGWLHLAVLIALGLALLTALVRARGAVAWPGHEAARRRVEQSSGLADRPLTALDDELVAGRGDRVAEALWQRHRDRMTARLGRLRAGWPAPGMARRDPVALRALVVLLLVVGAVAAGATAPERLWRALNPALTAPAEAAQAAIEIWVTPPAHTGRAPIFLDRTTPADRVLEIPTASQVLARLHGAGRAPGLEAGAADIAFEARDGETFQAEAEITAGGRLAISRDGRELVGWNFSVIADAAPTVEFAQAPSRSQRDYLRIEYLARDDYGVETVTARIHRLDAAGEPATGDGEADEIVLELALPGLHLEEATASSYHDLTPHPWAGLPARIVLEATDAIGQTGTSDPFDAVLPERVFQHPVARALVELRKRLTVDDSRETREAVAGELRGLASRPHHFYSDKIVFLAMVMGARRLELDDGAAAVARVQDLLWDTALRIEDGELSLAERDLRDAQQAMMDALARNASPEEIEQLMESLRQALDRYMQAMLENMMEENAENPAEAPMPDEDAMTLQMQDLQDMIDQAHELARQGDTQAAREMLQRLADILQNMRPMAQSGQSQQGEANQMMRDLGEMIRRQQELMENTFRQWQEGLQGEADAGEAEQGAATQEELRRQLGDMMRRFGERFGDIPRELGAAEQSMRGAREALSRGMPGRAVGPQGDALDQLREGGREMARSQQGFAQGPNGEGRGFDRDPLGRPLPGFGRADTENVDIPDIGDIQRARQILDELRRRAGERDRPRDELDYIERLLRRF